MIMVTGIWQNVFVKEGISVVYNFSGRLFRTIETGGGAGGDDLLVLRSSTSNCDSLCSWLETVGYFDSCCIGSSPAYYAKCFDAVASSPLNGRRLAFPSQIGTTSIDPSLPAMNTPNITSCRRMF